MSLEDLGNIGELVAAIGVIASLVYLAVQIRQNTRSLRLSTHHTIASRGTDLNRTFADSADLARITLIGDQDPNELSVEDRRRWMAWNLTRFRHYEDLYYQYSHEMIDESYWNGFRRWHSYNLRQPGIDSFWGENKRAFRDEFVTYVDSLLAKGRGRSNG